MYFVRVLIDPDHFEANETRQKKRELRRSLGTKCPVAARRISFNLNALLEGAASSRRENIVNEFFAHGVSAWTLPGGITCNDKEDQDRLERFLTKFPQIVDALAQRIASAPTLVNDSTSFAGPSSPSAANVLSIQNDTVRLTVERPNTMTPAPTPVSPHPHPTPPAPDIGSPYPQRVPLPPHRWPKNPKRFTQACVDYLAYHNRTLKSQSKRTSGDKGELLDQFHEFLQAKHPELGEDPWVHDLDSSHVSMFLQKRDVRPGKRKNAEGEVMPLAPATMLKTLGDLRHFFDYQRRTAKTTTERIWEEFETAAQTWSQQAESEGVHYWPFTDEHIKTIFDPLRFLANNRDPDYFWCPLLGLYLGIRLGEVVDAKICDVGYLEVIDTWYIEVPVDRAKNDHSVRWLPITQPLIDLGFLDYVEHVQELGGEYLFPNRDWDALTSQLDPSKNQSRKFGEYLDALEISHPKLVFHSFRHTLVTVMQDAGVPLSHAMQIAGHEAQDHAVRTKRITKEQARSMHLTVYTHADLERLGTKYPLLALRTDLERSMTPPIDLCLLKKAATIVTKHVKKVGGRFRSGWPPQRTKYTEEILKQLKP